MFNIYLKKKLIFNKLKINGRNNQGRIICYHRGGGSKQNYCRLDFNKYIWYIYAIVINEIYNCIKKTFMSLLLYTNGIFSFIPTIKKLFIGSIIYTGTGSNIKQKIGYILPIYNYLIGTHIHLLLINKEIISKYIRSPGTYGRISKNLGSYYILKLRSNYYFKVSLYSIATIGILLNTISIINYKTAGNSRYYGIKPHVRGVAMNPVDHPHGGGQGKTSGGRPSSSKWGWYTKGRKTYNLKWRRFSNKTYSFMN